MIVWISFLCIILHRCISMENLLCCCPASTRFYLFKNKAIGRKIEDENEGAYEMKDLKEQDQTGIPDQSKLNDIPDQSKSNGIPDQDQSQSNDIPDEASNEKKQDSTNTDGNGKPQPSPPNTVDNNDPPLAGQEIMEDETNPPEILGEPPVEEILKPDDPDESNPPEILGEPLVARNEVMENEGPPESNPIEIKDKPPTEDETPREVDEEQFDAGSEVGSDIGATVDNPKPNTTEPVSDVVHASAALQAHKPTISTDHFHIYD